MRKLPALVAGTLLLLGGCTSQKPRANPSPTPARSVSPSPAPSPTSIGSTAPAQAHGASALFWRLEADGSCHTTVSGLFRAQPSGALVATGIPWSESDDAYVSTDGRHLAVVQRRGNQTIL